VSNVVSLVTHPLLHILTQNRDSRANLCWAAAWDSGVLRRGCRRPSERADTARVATSLRGSSQQETTSGPQSSCECDTSPTTNRPHCIQHTTTLEGSTRPTDICDSTLHRLTCLFGSHVCLTSYRTNGRRNTHTHTRSQKI